MPDVPKTDVTLPQLGESVVEGTVVRWFKQVGDHVAVDEVLFEVSTDKVDSEVPASAAGVLAEILVAEGETAEVGAVVARLSPAAGSGGPAETADVARDTVSAASAHTGAPPEVSREPERLGAGADATVDTDVTDDDGPNDDDADDAPRLTALAESLRVSPLTRRIARQSSVDVAGLPGTGPGGRVTREDVERAAGSGLAAPSRPAPARPHTPVATPPPVSPRPAARRDVDVDVPGKGTVVPFNRIRARTGEHMVRSMATSPHAMTAIEVVYTNVDRTRLGAKAEWSAREGYSLTYLPFIARAVCDALVRFPHLNASVTDAGLQLHDAVHMAIAVDLDFDGLLAPVIRGADGLRVRGLARAVHDLAERARSRRLGPDELSGGTFTISNSGSYGTRMVIPIINQPQVAILSTDGIARRPVVITAADGSEALSIASTGMLTMSWDHRAIDGAYAAAFLADVKRVLETHDWSIEL